MATSFINVLHLVPDPSFCIKHISVCSQTHQNVCSNAPLVSKQDGTCSAGAAFHKESEQNMTAPLTLLLDIHYH